MGEQKGIKVHLFLILGLQFTVGSDRSPVLIRSEETLVLSCQCVIKGQIDCNGTTWVHSSRSPAVELVNLGHVTSNNKSTRLSVAADCSLVIRDVSEEDAGYYGCEQYKLGVAQNPHIQAALCSDDLSVVHMTEQKDTDVVTLNCSVKRSGHCDYTVKWLPDCSTGNTGFRQCGSEQPGCSAAVCFVENSFTQRCKFTCEVTNTGTRAVFNYDHQSPEEKSGKTTSKPTRKSEEATKSVPTTLQPSLNKGALYIAVAVVLVALLIVVGVLIGWRTKRTNNQVHDYAEVNQSSPNAPETCSDTVDAENVYYSTIGEAQVQLNRVERDVTYSTVGAPGVSVAAYSDPKSIYCLITSPGK